MAAVKALLRIFSYFFHALLTLFLLAVSGLTLVSSPGSLHLGMLPWTGPTLVYVVFLGALTGLACLVLALFNRLRALFFVWSLAVLVLMVKGYIFSGYHLAPGEARTALYLIAAAFVSLAGAWFQMWRDISRERRY